MPVNLLRHFEARYVSASLLRLATWGRSMAWDAFSANVLKYMMYIYIYIYIYIYV